MKVICLCASAFAFVFALLALFAAHQSGIAFLIGVVAFLFAIAALIDDDSLSEALIWILGWGLVKR